ncbi:MAG: hypothetical protein HYR96_06115, partial [Deltaproteobacteria bacterium]|nr:hypothetical protein [Deltaproteobacteria bacterium]
MVPNPENQSLPIEDELHFRRKQEQLEELKSKIQVVTSNLAMPLYMAFWICDLVFAPEHKWLFLSYRIFTVLACLGIHFSAPRARTLRSAQILAVLFTFVCSLFITIMTLQ